VGGASCVRVGGAGGGAGAGDGGGPPSSVLPWGPRTPGSRCIMSPGSVSTLKPDRVPRTQGRPMPTSPLLPGLPGPPAFPPPTPVSCARIYSGRPVPLHFRKGSSLIPVPRSRPTCPRTSWGGGRSLEPPRGRGEAASPHPPSLSRPLLRAPVPAHSPEPLSQAPEAPAPPVPLLRIVPARGPGG
jgi:hypothetical protein